VSAERQLREVKLSPPVEAWLEAQGLIVYSEVPLLGRNIDLVGVARTGIPRHHAVVEIKMRLGPPVIKQAAVSQLTGARCFCAVASAPERHMAAAEKVGVGVLVVEAGAVRELLQPTTMRIFHRRQYSLVRTVSRMTPGGRGGLPNLKGVGPAQDVERAIAAYRATHPRATWRQLYQAVPNHYASARSMQGSMAMLRERRHRLAILAKPPPPQEPRP